MKRTPILTLSALIIGLLPACDSYKYNRQQISMHRGDAFRDIRLKQVKPDGIWITRIPGTGTQPRFLPLAGQPHQPGSHSMGNNEWIRIHQIDPKKQTADLEFSWLASVSWWTIPPF